MQHLLQDFQNVSNYSRTLRNKGLTLKHENVLCWLDNDFVLIVIKLHTLHLHLGPNHLAISSLNLTLESSAFMSCGRTFQTLGPNVARFLSPKVADRSVNHLTATCDSCFKSATDDQCHQ